MCVASEGGGIDAGLLAGDAVAGGVEAQLVGGAGQETGEMVGGGDGQCRCIGSDGLRLSAASCSLRSR